LLVADDGQGAASLRPYGIRLTLIANWSASPDDRRQMNVVEPSTLY